MPRDRRLSPLEAQRALYIDFEGRKGQRPVMLGRMFGTDRVDDVRQVTTDDRFVALTAGTDAPNWPFDRAIDMIIRMAEKKDRMIVAWSIHELELVALYSPHELDRFKKRFVNAKLLAERWKSKSGQPKPKPNTLPAWLSLERYEVPHAARAGITGRSIERLEGWLAKGTTITPERRQRWLDILEHNRHDCNGMREICLVAAADIARIDGA